MTNENFVAAFFYLLSIVITIFITRHYSFRSALKIILTSIINLFDLSKFEKWKLDVLLNGKAVESLWVIKIILENCGNSDLIKTMECKPIKLTFPKNFEICDIKIGKIDKNEIEASFDGDSIEIKIQYFKRKSIIPLQILATMKKAMKIDPNDIKLADGLIINTKINLIDFVNKRNLFIKSVFPFLDNKDKIDKLYKFFLHIYFILGIYIIIIGVISILNIVWTNNFIPTFFINKFLYNNLFESIFITIFGILFFIVNFFNYKYFYYSKLFDTLEREKYNSSLEI